jgi:hypothetical protein
MFHTCYSFNPLKTEFLLLIYINSVRTSQETHNVTTTETNRLMLFGDTVAVYCDNHREHTDTLCGKNENFLYVKVGGTYCNMYAMEWPLLGNVQAL